ncbi:MFS transporter [Pseudonocardia acaciae]|uniref:MFS transporter n=1 Tax=Pseudonocardia acaciae TaxID=551276 RepID=UPI000688B235|nr:MFS transporter [Pseudonocardia acaciae]
MHTRTIALAAVILAAVMDLVDGTVVNTVLPVITRELAADGAAAGWIASAYPLALGVLMLVGGRLGDRFGHRRVLLAAAAGFGAASLACALARTAGELVAARAAHGVTAAIMVPQALALIQLLYPPTQRGRALSVFAAVAGVATVAGPIGGAVLTEADPLGLGWRAVFLVNLPLVALVLAAGTALPASQGDRRAALDLPGAVLLAGSLVLALLALLRGGEHGWTGTEAALLLGASVVFAGFVAVQRRRGGSALVDPGLFRAAGFTGAVLVTASVYAAVFGLFFTFTLYLQSGLGWSPAHAAVTILPWALGIPMASAPAARWLVPAHGRRVLQAGVALFVLGLLALLAATGTHAATTVGMLPGLLVAGVGMGLIVAPVLGLGLAGVPAHLAGAASGVINNVQQVAGAVGLGVVGSVYVAGPRDEITGALWVVVALAAAAAPAVRLLPRS